MIGSRLEAKAALNNIIHVGCSIYIYIFPRVSAEERGEGDVRAGQSFSGR